MRKYALVHKVQLYIMVLSLYCGVYKILRVVDWIVDEKTLRVFSDKAIVIAYETSNSKYIALLPSHAPHVMGRSYITKLKQFMLQ